MDPKPMNRCAACGQEWWTAHVCQPPDDSAQAQLAALRAENRHLRMVLSLITRPPYRETIYFATDSVERIHEVLKVSGEWFTRAQPQIAPMQAIEDEVVRLG